MKYLDSNVFLYPLLYKGKKATKAQNILNEMVLGKAPCITSSLTLDEIIWIIMKMHDRTKAIEIARDVLSLPNLKILDVTNEHILQSLDLMEKYQRLKPRDAIHIAVCINAGVFTIISDDTDFENIAEIKRIPLA